MKKLGALLAVTTLISMAGAGAAQAMIPDDGPGSGATDTINVDDTFTVPKGYACDVGIRLHYTATETDAFSLDGVTVLISSPDGRATFTNVKTNKSIKRVVDGGFAYRIQDDGSLKGWGFGRNFYYGMGVRGLLIEDGVQVFRDTNPGEANDTIHWISRTGPREDVCRTLGAKPVQGKNPPAATQDSSSMTPLARMKG